MQAPCTSTVLFTLPGSAHVKTGPAATSKPHQEAVDNSTMPQVLPDGSACCSTPLPQLETHRQLKTLGHCTKHSTEPSTALPQLLFTHCHSSVCAAAACLGCCSAQQMFGRQPPAYSSLARALSRLVCTATSLVEAESLSFLRRARSRSSTYRAHATIKVNVGFHC